MAASCCRWTRPLRPPPRATFPQGSLSATLSILMANTPPASTFCGRGEPVRVSRSGEDDRQPRRAVARQRDVGPKMQHRARAWFRASSARRAWQWCRSKPIAIKSPARPRSRLCWSRGGYSSPDLVHVIAMVWALSALSRCGPLESARSSRRATETASSYYDSTHSQAALSNHPDDL
jgi:hypothetical protein